MSTPPWQSFSPLFVPVNYFAFAFHDTLPRDGNHFRKVAKTFLMTSSYKKRWDKIELFCYVETFRFLGQCMSCDQSWDWTQHCSTGLGKKLFIRVEINKLQNACSWNNKRTTPVTLWINTEKVAGGLNCTNQSIISVETCCVKPALNIPTPDTSDTLLSVSSRRSRNMTEH